MCEEFTKSYNRNFWDSFNFIESYEVSQFLCRALAPEKNHDFASIFSSAPNVL